MSTTSTLIAAFLPIMGIIIGASLQFLFSRSSTVHKQHYLSRNQAYIDYLNCVAKLANIAKFGAPKERKDVLALAADSKTRICIYGSKAVIKSLAVFEKSGARIDSDSSAEKFVNICNEMRKEGLGRKQKAEVSDLLNVLFGIKGW